MSALQFGQRQRPQGTRTRARATDAVRFGSARRALALRSGSGPAPRGSVPGSPLAPGTNSGQSHDAGAALSASLPRLAGTRFPAWLYDLMASSLSLLSCSFPICIVDPSIFLTGMDLEMKMEATFKGNIHHIFDEVRETKKYALRL
ncbi:uncharacterized protein LOC143663134 isoform X2 [Tamandua tetradactyla]|uniref:uncharacterized protein LOC143663134 isoform X2 n=1 Tax=Tamandua tetradactyla TaxID=48850 RepID=UPI0040537DE1